jgi:hypothetical protein
MSFYEEDLAALFALRSELARLGVNVSARLLVRALAHVATDAEIFAHTLARHQAEAAGKAGAKDTIAELGNYVLLNSDLERFQRIGFDLEVEQVRGGRSFIMRSLIHAPWEMKKLAKAVAQFRREFPDARTREVRALRGRG